MIQVRQIIYGQNISQLTGQNRKYNRGSSESTLVLLPFPNKNTPLFKKNIDGFIDFKT